jgi:hypothetical protein
MRILPGCAIYVGFLGVAETAEYAMLAPMRRVCEVSDDCRDHRLCVFDADAQRVLSSGGCGYGGLFVFSSVPQCFCTF